MAQIARKGVFCIRGKRNYAVYETKIIIPSRKGQGLTGLSVGDKGPSVIDRATNVAIGLLVLFLLYSVVEPFWSSSASEAQLNQLDVTISSLIPKLKEYEQSHGPYTGINLNDLQGKGLDEVPLDPWGNPFFVDPFFKRIISSGPNGVLETKISAMGNEVKSPTSDDRIGYYLAQGTIWYTVKSNDACVTMRASADGTLIEQVGGSAYSDGREIAPSPNLKRLAVSSETSTGRQIIICNSDYSDAEFVTNVGENRWPTWTSDGGTVLYESKRELEGSKAYHLFKYNLALRQEKQVTRGSVNFRTPRCHPTDSDKVVCVGISNSLRKPKLYLLSIDGFTLNSAPLNDNASPEKSPAWHFGGKQLLFLAKAGSNVQVFAENIHNRSIRKLSNFVEDKPVALDSSPFDDRYVVALKKADGSYEIAVADSQNEKICPILKSTEPIASLRWTP